MTGANRLRIADCGLRNEPQINADFADNKRRKHLCPSASICVQNEKSEILPAEVSAKAGRNPKSAIRSESGQAVAEFAIAFPVLLMLVLGIVQISLMFVARTVVEYATFAAARAELVHEDPQRAAEMICSSISGPTYTRGTGHTITVPGWGVLPRSESASIKTSASVIDPLDDGNGVVTVEVTHLYELVVPVASLIFKPISRPVQPGDVPDGLFVTMNTAPHMVLRCRYTRPVPWSQDPQSHMMTEAHAHPVIPNP